ncbi:hypothetical protein H6770_04590 [Candidatus Peribacteria bacterium]|nr:hypothetical protein [Candidatus Peribacteria bacterium]
MKRTIALSACGLLLLSGCTLVEVTEDPSNDTTPLVEEEPVRETQNVTYIGTLQPAGISIYQQGSHRLVLPGGKFILLESDALDLNGYVNEEVQVFGALRPTIEAGGMIMRVERIELTEQEESSSSSSVDEEVAEVKEVEQETEVVEESSSSEMSMLEEVSSSSSEESSSQSSEPSAAFLENLEIMSRQDFSPEGWTQEYCSSHVGFCIPVHRNFWFKSFGATDNVLWHVEFSAAPVERLSEGPISLELRAGSKAELDGTVEEVNGIVVAYKEWTFGRHFVISSDKSLETAVRYMMSHITEYTQ